MNKLYEKPGKWTYIVPVSNVVLTADLHHEFRIDRVTLVNLEALKRRRIRLGLSRTVSALEGRSQGLKQHFFAGRHAFAIVRCTGQLKNLEPEVLNTVREELAILALSQLGYTKRRSVAAPTLGDERLGGMRSHLAIHAADGSWAQSTRRVGPFQPLSLNSQWRAFQQRTFFCRLVNVLRGSPRVSRDWRRDLWNASVLVGMSQTSTDIPQAFLWNMIALELLLTRQGDTYSQTLPARVEAFLGWAGDWRSLKFEERIRDAYKRRCLLVHQGRRDAVSMADLLFTDDLLLNVFMNLLHNLRLFGSKEDVIQFAKRLEAERLLGAKPRVRPKSLLFLRRTYNERDLEPM